MEDQSTQISSDSQQVRQHSRTFDCLESDSTQDESNAKQKQCSQKYSDIFPDLFKEKNAHKSKQNQHTHKKCGSSQVIADQEANENEEIKEVGEVGDQEDEKKSTTSLHKFIQIKDFQEFQQNFSRQNLHTEKSYNNQVEKFRTKSVELSKISEERKEEDIIKKYLSKIDQIVDKYEFMNAGDNRYQLLANQKIPQAQNSPDINLTIEEINEEGEKDKENIQETKYSRHSSQNNSAGSSPRIKVPKGDELDIDKKKFQLEQNTQPETIMEDIKSENEKNEFQITDARKTLESALTKLSWDTKHIQQIKVDEISSDDIATQEITSNLSIAQKQSFENSTEVINENEENYQADSDSEDSQQQ